MALPGQSDAPIDPGVIANRAEFSADIHCPNCAYCLQGLPGDTCPECGQSLAGLRAGESRIPWQSRRDIGRFRSYWRTVWMVTIRNRLFCEEYARPVSYRDARLFQLVTIMHVFLGAVLAVVLVYLFVPSTSEAADSILAFIFSGNFQLGPSLADRAYAEFWPAAGLLLCFLLFLAAATGVPSYFFHPRNISIRQQNTAIAMSYYTCGPVALAAFVLIAGSVLFQPLSTASPVEPPIAVTLILIAALPVILWWLNLVRLARRIMPQIKGRTALVGVATPLLWIALGGLLLVLLPLAVLWILVVIYSLG